VHEPMTVAFDIRRPWPSRSRSHDANRPGHPTAGPRWRFKHHHECDDDCRAEHAGQKFFPWWNPRSWTPFWVIAGYGFYFPSLITVWHVEPGGRDSGEVCRHYNRVQLPDGTWETKFIGRWRWHVHHWHIQIPPLQELRRRLLTRCEWCGGRSTRRDRVNVSHQWDRKRQPWWRGERGLFHRDCSMVEHAHRSCVCDDPKIKRGGVYGTCSNCGKHAAGRPSPSILERRRLLASIPAGQRDPDIIGLVSEIAERDRKRL